MALWTDLLVRVRQLLQERTSGNSLWPDTDTYNLTAKLKEGEIELILQAEANKVYSAANIVVGSSESTATYAWPSTALRVVEVRIAGEAAPLEQKSENEIQEIYGAIWRTKTGTPIYCVQNKLVTPSIRLVPMPTAAVTSGLEWVTINSPDQSGTSPTVHSQLHQFLPFYAAHAALLEDGANREQWGFFYLPPEMNGGKGGGLFWRGVLLARKMMRHVNRVEEIPWGIFNELNDWRNSF